jgi:hypothetical protein
MSAAVMAMRSVFSWARAGVAKARVASAAQAARGFRIKAGTARFTWNS